MKKLTYKLLVLVVSVAGAALIGACGSDKKSAADETVSGNVVAAETAAESAPADAKSVEEIYDEIAQSVELVSPVKMNDEFISNYYGIDPASLEEYVFSMSEEATSAETIVIMKAKDESAVSDIEVALGVVIDEKRSEMENYLPEQFEIVDKSSVNSSGNYVWLVISENQADILKILEENI